MGHSKRFLDVCVFVMCIFLILLCLSMSLQDFLWKVHLRPRLNVTTREMDPVTCATGPQSLGSMLCMSSATAKTFNTLPLWLRLSTHQAKTSTPTRYSHTGTRAHIQLETSLNMKIIFVKAIILFLKLNKCVNSRLRHMVQAFRAVVWLLESPLSSQLMPSKEEKLLWRSWPR